MPVLKALADDQLRTRADGRVVIGRPAGGHHPDRRRDRRGAEGPAPARLDRIIVNNRLRGAIEAALGGLTFSTPIRRTGWRGSGHVEAPSADAAAPLEKALAAEKDADPRRDARGLAAVRLFAGSTEERLAAVRTLGGTTDPQIKNLLDELRHQPDLDPKLRKRGRGGARRDRHRLRLTGLAANLFQGISLG